MEGGCADIGVGYDDMPRWDCGRIAPNTPLNPTQQKTETEAGKKTKAMGNDYIYETLRTEGKSQTNMEESDNAFKTSNIATGETSPVISSLTIMTFITRLLSSLDKFHHRMTFITK